MASRQPFGNVISRARLRGLFGALGLVLATTTPFAPVSRASDPSPPAETAPPEDSAAAEPSRATPEELYSRVAPSVVTILVKDENGEVVATGSGFFVDECELAELHVGMAGEAVTTRTARAAQALCNAAGFARTECVPLLAGASVVQALA